MSDTPRTVQLIGRILDKDGVVEEDNAPFAWVRLCKEIERELNAAKAALSGRTVSCSNCNAMAEENAAMREAITGVSKILRSIELNDIFEETMRNHAVLALSKLQPYLK